MTPTQRHLRTLATLVSEQGARRAFGYLAAMHDCPCPLDDDDCQEGWDQANDDKPPLIHLCWYCLDAPADAIMLGLCSQCANGVPGRSLGLVPWDAQQHPTSIIGQTDLITTALALEQRCGTPTTQERIYELHPLIEQLGQEIGQELEGS